jgi:sarcosine oxidase
VGSDGRCVVVGGGLLGLSAAWALSRRGWSVRVFEAGASAGHERCGSKGEARIFRLGYREAHYVEMALLARDLWRSLESTTGRTLLQVTGQLSFGDPASVEDVSRALARHDVPGQIVDGSSAAGRLAPGLVTHGPVLYEPESGVLAADQCLAALMEDGGLLVERGRQVASVRGDGSGGRSEGGVGSVVMSDGEALDADVVVVCAGPSSLGLVEGGLGGGGLGGRDLGGAAPRSVAAPASLPQVAYFQPRGTDGGGVPVFIEWGEAMTYGLPVPGGGTHAGLFKVSQHAPGAVLERYDPTDPSPMPDDDRELEALSEAVRRLLPWLDPTPVATERCVYDNSSDTDFVLDRIGSVVVGCGTSGHGFKFGPLLGQVLADLAEAVPPPVDLSPFRIDRLVVSSGS